MRTYYPDTNVLSYCNGHPLLNRWTLDGVRDLRSAIRERRRDRRIAIYGSLYHVEEGSRIPLPEARRAFLKHLWDAVGWFVLLPTEDFALNEVQSGGPLQGDDRFIAAHRLMDLKARCRWNSNLDEIGVLVSRRAQDFASHLRSRRPDVRARLEQEFAGLSISEVTRRWWRDSETRVQDWVSDYLEGSIEQLSLPSDRALWPGVGRLQTANAMYGYHMARIVLNVGLNETIGDGDAHDAHHFAMCCNADALVTEDAAFKRTIALIPGRRPSLLSFDEFAAELGVAPH